jgi:hypothetical protein
VNNRSSQVIPAATNPQWEIPQITKFPIRLTADTNGDDEDMEGGGIFLAQEPLTPPKHRWHLISKEDKSRIAEYLAAISRSPEKLEAAVRKPSAAMDDAGLTKNQAEVVKSVLSMLAR